MSAIIHEARNVLKRWGTDTSQPWIINRLEGRLVAMSPSLGTVGADAELILGMTDPRLRAAIDKLLASELEESGVCHCGTELAIHKYEEHNFVDMGYLPNPDVESIAAEIIRIDEEMNA